MIVQLCIISNAKVVLELLENELDFLAAELALIAFAFDRSEDFEGGIE